MMSGYGYETIEWMIVTMVIYSLVGVVVAGALVWIVVWSVTNWRRIREERALHAWDGDVSALDSFAGAGIPNSATVGQDEMGSQEDPSVRSDDLMLSRR